MSIAMEYASLALKTLMDNQECFVAQWILQNPEANMKDYTLVHKIDFMFGNEFSIKLKEGL